MPTDNRQEGAIVKRLLVLLVMIAVGVAVIRSRRAEVWHTAEDRTGDQGP